MKITSLFIVAAMSVASVGSVAFAQTAATTGTMMKDDMVTVVVISEANKSADGTQQVPDIYRMPSADTVAKAQMMIKEDAALMKNLEGKNVQMNNVVGVETAATGGKIVYVK